MEHLSLFNTVLNHLMLWGALFATGFAFGAILTWIVTEADGKHRL